MGTAKQQGEVWGARAHDWFSANEPAWTSLFEAVLDQAGVHRGTKLLDVGCGAGGALVLARGRGAEVAGLDAAPALVEIARARLPGATIAVGEMEELPFAGGIFDVVTGINSFQFAADPANALREAGRVAREDGTVALLVWGRREACAFLSRVMPGVFALLPPAPEGAPRPPALAEPGVIDDMLARARLTPGHDSEIPATLSYPDQATAIRAVLSGTARAIAHAGEDRVRSAVEEGLRPFVRDDGSVSVDNIFRLVLATRH